MQRTWTKKCHYLHLLLFFLFSFTSNARQRRRSRSNVCPLSSLCIFIDVNDHVFVTLHLALVDPQYLYYPHARYSSRPSSSFYFLLCTKIPIHETDEKHTTGRLSTLKEMRWDELQINLDIFVCVKLCGKNSLSPHSYRRRWEFFICWLPIKFNLHFELLKIHLSGWDDDKINMDIDKHSVPC